MFGIDNVREFVRECGCELVSEVYLNAKSKLSIRCKCGNVFNSTYDNFKTRTNKCCKVCLKEIAKNKKSLNIDYVRKYVVDNSNSILLSTQYIASDVKLLFKCKCGKEFEQSFDSFRNGKYKQCPSCSLKDRSNSQRYSKEQVEEISKKYGNILAGDYVSYHTKTDFLCKCGAVVNTTLARVVTRGGIGCRRCVDDKLRRDRKHSIEYIKGFIEKTGNLYVGGEYKNNTSKIEIKCKCGNNYITRFAEFKSGKITCDYCSKRISRGERFVGDVLNELNLEYIREYRFDDCRYKRPLPFDFYIPSLNVCIEYNGSQHYNDFKGKYFKELHIQRRNDDIKTKYCNEKGIKLIVIPYWIDFSDIKELILSKVK